MVNQGRQKQMKILLPAIGGLVIALVLYALHAPSFLILVAGIGAALIISVRHWERNPAFTRGKGRLAGHR
jgi:hypothetical protein